MLRCSAVAALSGRRSVECRVVRGDRAALRCQRTGPHHAAAREFECARIFLLHGRSVDRHVRRSRIHGDTRRSVAARRRARAGHRGVSRSAWCRGRRARGRRRLFADSAALRVVVRAPDRTARDGRGRLEVAADDRGVPWLAGRAVCSVCRCRAGLAHLRHDAADGPALAGWLWRRASASAAGRCGGAGCRAVGHSGGRCAVASCLVSGVDGCACRSDLASPNDLPPNYWGHLKLPFGPFLALGALEYLFFGEQLVDLWMRLSQPA